MALAWKGKEKVYIQSGITPGETVIVSQLATPVQGMPIGVVDDNSDGDKDVAAGK